MTRYALGSNGILTFEIEASAYEKEDPADTELGFTDEPIDPPNPNPHTPTPTGGVDGPYIQSPQPREYAFDATSRPHQPENFEFLEVVLGDVDNDTDLNDDYEYWNYTLDRPLQTATIQHRQTDLDLVRWYIGAKAGLTVNASQGEALSFDYSITAAASDYDPEETPSEPSSNLNTNLQPYMFDHLGEVEYDSTLIATVTGIELSIDHGLEANHHGDAGEDLGRDAYSVSEETNADIYSLSIDYKIADEDLYEQAVENQDPVDIRAPFVRQMNNGAVQDGVILRANEATNVDAELPYNPEGSLDGTAEFNPNEVEIEVREPL